MEINTTAARTKNRKQEEKSITLEDKSQLLDSTRIFDASQKD